MQCRTTQDHCPRRTSGFTLVEMLLVLLILSILAAISLPLAELTSRRYKEAELRRSLREIRDAIDAYKRAADAGQIASAANESGYPPNLDVLIKGVTGTGPASGTKIYLLRQLPRDPFAPADVAHAASTWRLRSYASEPDDPRPGSDVFDVFSGSEEVGLNGIAYQRW